MTKPIILYGHAGGPNPWKVALILEELALPYEHKIMDMSDLKKPPFEALNPNGRVLVITDTNTGITLWESGLIIEYLVATYDKSSRLTYNSSPEKFYVSQWVHFQMSGQGPYFGQAAWFKHYHPEEVKSAKERYFEQVKRVFYVINKALGENGGRAWLVGDKCTIADLSFVTWDVLVPWIFGDEADELQSEVKEKYPRYFEWNKRLMARETVTKIVEDRRKALADH
ncbi:glutathione S-transferase [Tricladium varicosporioides]|nr:glutathione S-transferase [Hymenoscyphus varicosporioides]